LLLARRKHPGGANRLDDLCARYGIDNTRRTKHGALLDAEILGEVYIELIGARQAALELEEVRPIAAEGLRLVLRTRAVPLAPRVTAADRAAHLAFVATLGEGALWHTYRPAVMWAAAATP